MANYVRKELVLLTLSIGTLFSGCSSLPNNVGAKAPGPEMSATYALSVKEAGLDCQHLQ
jgi:uncharacterized protein YceK